MMKKVVNPMAVLFMLNLAAGSCFGSAIVSQSVSRDLAEWTAAESELGVLTKHQTRSLLVQESANTIRTPIAVVIIHGLLNSPASMNWIAEKVHGLNINVINVRLPGHYQKDRTITDQFQYTVAIEEIEKITALATQLGERVVYIGHSVGGLLAVNAAIDHPETTAGLILFSPAFKVTSLTYYSSYILSYFGISGWLPDQFVSPETLMEHRYLSTYAGVQVDLLAHHLTYLTDVKQRLNNLPVFWIDTEVDRVIDISTNQELAYSLEQSEYHLFSHKLKVNHDHTPKEASQDTSLESKVRKNFTKKWMEFLTNF